VTDDPERGLWLCDIEINTSGDHWSYARPQADAHAA
jgi:hypothetical protein